LAEGKQRAKPEATDKPSSPKMSATLTKTSTKKRSAPLDSKASQPPRKKLHLDPSSSSAPSKKSAKPKTGAAPKHAGKAKAAPARDEPQKKRSRPVTATREESDDEDEAEWKTEEEEDQDPMDQDEDSAQDGQAGKQSGQSYVNVWESIIDLIWYCSEGISQAATTDAGRAQGCKTT